MHTLALAPVGVEITDIALDEVGPDEVARLRGLLAEHGVAIIPGQDLDDADFVAFLAAFGELTFTRGETPVPDAPELNVVTNVGRTTPPRSNFHVDTSYVRRPPAYTALRAVEIPIAGGATQFTNQYRAYDTLPEAVRTRLDGRTIRHVVTGIDPTELGADDETTAEHPIFRRHPVSGRTALYLSSAARCAAISGMGDQETVATVAELLAHSTRPDNVRRHVWAPGDVVMWDNGCVLHRADHDGVVGNRVLHRGMVAS